MEGHLGKQGRKRPQIDREREQREREKERERERATNNKYN